MKPLPISQKMMIFLVLLTNVVPPLSIDEYTPSMPHMVGPLGTTISMMQLTVTLYMLTFALSQVIGGVLSDRYGRRPTLLWSMPIFLMGSVVCLLAGNMTMLVMGRLLQGFGVGISALSGPALIADCFEGEDVNKVSGYYSTVYSFIPISAPVIGGILQDLLGWRANFGFMLLLGIVVFACFWRFLPETHQPQAQHQINLKNIVHNYGAVLRNGRYLLAVLAMIFVWSLFVVFSVMAPFLIQNSLHYSSTVYGVLALLVGLGFFVGNALNTQLVKSRSPKQAKMLGLSVMVIASLILLMLPSVGVFTLWSIMAPIFIVMIGGGLCFPHLYADAVSAVTEYAGIAGALIGSLILTGAVIITAIVTRLHAHSPVAMASVFLLLSVLAGVVVLVNRHQ